MSGLRFVMLSRGNHSSLTRSDLTPQLLAGSANGKKDAKEEALKCKRRPITLNMLVLLQHAIASNSTWSSYEKSLRWSVILLAYWGSFRMGELVNKEKSTYNNSTSLLPTDIQFKPDCVTVWIRSPKIWSEGGDIVEVWKVKENPSLDPVAALSCFTDLRNSRHGISPDIHETTHP